MLKIDEVIKDKRQKLKMFEEIRKCLKSSKDPATQGTAELRKFMKEQTAAPKSVEQCQ
jgi:hypothetical protein